MTFEELFETRLDQLVRTYSGKTLIFLKGFQTPQLRHLLARPDSLLNDPELLSEQGLVPELLQARGEDCLNAIRAADRPLVGFYEELLVLWDRLPELDSVRTVVLENNLLAPWVPSCFAPELGLKLFDYWQEDDEPEDEITRWLCGCYGEARLLEGEQLLLLPRALEGVETVPFWPEETDYEEPEDGWELIEADSLRDWSFCTALLRDQTGPAIFLREGEELSPRHSALLWVARAMGLPVCFDELELYREQIHYSDRQFTPILQQYWGKSAAFRPLLFYRDPDHSGETEEITQGQIIAEIVDQCERAVDEDTYSNVFITAPTGSGKSILFQIPALYLAQRYERVTIVVSPLIALMNDQVDQLEKERGISIAACIHSGMTMEERLRVIREVHAGKKSLLYLAPELLLTTPLQTLLGERELGLVVVDEAHTVTSWGRDFRSDYWFLGNFFKKTSRAGYRFPVLCLTATAVYSGRDDVVNDTIRELGLDRTIIHLGNVKRDNIAFDIRAHKAGETGRGEPSKLKLVLEQVRGYAEKKEKALAYFPYRSQVNELYNQVSVGERTCLRRYHSRVPDAERRMTENSYKRGEALGLFCTKAFGMGIDVADIRHVVHFAPTGTLSDYVQEIGRAARNPDIQGTAHIDFFPGDLRYVRALNSISEMRQYQLQELLRKLCTLYNRHQQQNLLISAETFEYLFPEDEVENRTKSGLMLLARDLDAVSHFPVLVVRPRAMQNRSYINVPAALERDFLKHYGSYAQLQQGAAKRVETTSGQGRTVEIYSSGSTYLVDMAAIWENCYPEMAFGLFRKAFFEHEYKAGREKHHYAPRARVEVQYGDSFEAVAQRVEEVVSAIQAIFHRCKTGEAKRFTLQQFEDELNQALGDHPLDHDRVALLLDIFTEGAGENAAYVPTYNQVRVLRRRRQPGAEESTYFVSSISYTRMTGYFTRQLEQCAPNEEDNVFCRFYPLTQNRSIAIMPTLRLLELLGLGSYEIRGGEKAEVFLRINDPQQLLRLSRGEYVNQVLQAIQERHRHNDRLLTAFFNCAMSTEERWELIEQYFLGNEDYVRERLELED